MAPSRRPSPTSHPRPTQNPAGLFKKSAPQRPKLSAEQLVQLSGLMRKHFRWDADPRPFQLEGVRAQLEGTDMIIQAPTGAGKTAVAAGPHLWHTSIGKTTIMVCPLLTLEEEMVETFKTEFGLKAIAINSVTGAVTRAVVQDLRDGKYQIILISPEMLQSPSFVNRVLRQRDFARRVLSVVVDEAHCISHWGASFRKKYASLGVICTFLNRGTPIIAVTATLTARIRRDLHRVLHFPKSGSRFINVGNDRPNVAIVVRACQYPQNSYVDLDFILPSHPTSAADIPKTYVYVDNIALGSDVVDHLCTILVQRNPALSATELIRPFNATMSPEYRKAAMAAFRANPSPNDEESAGREGESPNAGCRPGCIRVLVCTDAAGMGCNVPDVDLVVQWKLPKTFSNFIQRAGRAARSCHRSGLAVMLVERSVYTIDLRPSSSKDVPVGTKTKGKGRVSSSKKGGTRRTTAAPKGYAESHGVNRGGTTCMDTFPSDGHDPVLDLEAEDEGLLAFVQARKCRRKVWAQAFESQIEPRSPESPCCDICTPSILNRTRPSPRTTVSKPRMRAKGQPDYHAQKPLFEWRERVFARDHLSSQLDPTAILDASTITTLTSVGRLSSTQVATMLQDTWIWWTTYGEELTELLVSLEITYRPLSKAAANATDGPVVIVLPSAISASKRPAGVPVDDGAESGGSESPAKRARVEDEDSRQLQPPTACSDALSAAATVSSSSTSSLHSALYPATSMRAVPPPFGRRHEVPSFAPPSAWPSNYTLYPSPPPSSSLCSATNPPLPSSPHPAMSHTSSSYQASHALGPTANTPAYPAYNTHFVVASPSSHSHTGSHGSFPSQSMLPRHPPMPFPAYSSPSAAHQGQYAAQWSAYPVSTAHVPTPSPSAGHSSTSQEQLPDHSGHGSLLG